MPAVWNDSERCAEIAIEELEICLFGAQDILIDVNFRCWGMTPSHIEAQLGPDKFPLDANDEVQNYIRKLAIAELLANPRYATRVMDADEMLDAQEQRLYARDCGYGHQQHERM
jgi:hypothetical protein